LNIELNILHLADSALPVGGFAYSYGLESAVRHGLLSDRESTSAYLHTFAQQVISFDFPFVCSAHGLAADGLDKALLSILLNDYEAMLLNVPVQKAGMVLGKNWMRLMQQLSGASEEIKKLEDHLAAHQLKCHFPVIFGIASQLAGLDLKQTLSLYFYMTLRDQISALIRLGAAGPSWAHAELSHLLTQFSKTIENFGSVPYEQATKTAYLLEITQLSHERVYSKLFQN
jgi:urease accessory protein